MTQFYISSHLLSFRLTISQFLNFTIRWPPTRLSARLSLVISHVRVAIRPAQLSRSHTYLNSRVILSSSTFTSKTNHQQNTSQFSSQFTTYFITNIITNHSQISQLNQQLILNTIHNSFNISTNLSLQILPNQPNQQKYSTS